MGKFKLSHNYVTLAGWVLKPVQNIEVLDNFQFLTRREILVKREGL